MLRPVLTALFVLTACGSPVDSPDEPRSDAGSDRFDASAFDAGPTDAASPDARASDAGRPDAGPPIVATLVDSGRARARIITTGAPGSTEAAAELRDAIEAATGVRLDLTPAARFEPDASMLALIVGDSPLAGDLGVSSAGFEDEEYRLVLLEADNAVVFVGEGRGANAADPLQWAVQAFLDRFVGVRWLWPGALGTYIPTSDTVAIPAFDIRARHPLEDRVIRSSRSPAVTAWTSRHQTGRRIRYQTGHAFEDWWDRFHTTRPGLLATPPSPGVEPNRPEYAKLNVSNPAVIDQILMDWRAAGRPSLYGVGENDGVFFCTSAGSRAMDLPDVYSPADIWAGRIDLTRRYLTFWNRIVTRMREENPDVIIGANAYSAYRTPPTDVAVEPGIVLKIVNGYGDAATDAWRGWYEAGAHQLILRPNWWHMAGDAPHLPLHQVADHIHMAHEQGMVGSDFDTLFGYWGTQGVYYYLVARLLMRPELSADEVIGEYTSAFGAAAPTIRAYLDYWEAFTERAAFAVPAGGATDEDPDGLYAMALAEHRLPTHPLSGNWRALPYVYTDEVIAPGRALLDEALALADSPDAIERVEFLRDALALFVLRREILTRRYATPFVRAPYDRALRDWTTLRDAMLDRYGPVMEGGPIPARLESTPCPGC